MPLKNPLSGPKLPICSVRLFVLSLNYMRAQVNIAVRIWFTIWGAKFKRASHGWQLNSMEYNMSREQEFTLNNIISYQTHLIIVKIETFNFSKVVAEICSWSRVHVDCFSHSIDCLCPCVIWYSMQSKMAKCTAHDLDYAQYIYIPTVWLGSHWLIIDNDVNDFVSTIIWRSSLNIAWVILKHHITAGDYHCLVVESPFSATCKCPSLIKYISVCRNQANRQQAHSLGYLLAVVCVQTPFASNGFTWACIFSDRKSYSCQRVGQELHVYPV